MTIPEIEVMRLAHYLTIGSECSTSLSPHLEKLYVVDHHYFILIIILIQTSNSNADIKSHQNRDFKELGWDVRVALAVYGAFSSKDYIQAQRIR